MPTDAGHAVSLDEQTYQCMHSKSTTNYFRFTDPVIDELCTKLRQTPDRTEQRAITKKIVEREHDQILRMWMAYDAGFLISLAVLGFNLFGDTLRDAWDPKLRRQG